VLYPLDSGNPVLVMKKPAYFLDVTGHRDISGH